MFLITKKKYVHLKLLKIKNMKNIILLFVFVLIGVFSYSQAPSKMSYQAVIRNSSNQLVVNSMIGMKISILQGSTTGPAVYIETQTHSTNTNGLVSLEIGNGTIQFGSFSSIDWANGPYFIKTETDITGGTSYTIEGITQLLSVPYALYSETSGSSMPGPQGPQGNTGAQGIQGVPGNNTLVKTTVEVPGLNCNTGGVKLEYGIDANNNSQLDLGEINIALTKYVCNGNTGPQGPQGAAGTGGFTHYVGEYFGGGVVFNVYRDSLGIEHGLIVSINDLSSSFLWSNVSNLIGLSAQSLTDGYTNTMTIVSQPGHINSAANLCLNYSNQGQDDWYLPSFLELKLIFDNLININMTLNSVNNAEPLKHSLEHNIGFRYWTSTEWVNDMAYFYDLPTVAWGLEYSNEGKNQLLRVRAIRRF